MRLISLIMIGGSSGSVTAVQEILKGLDKNFKIPIAIVMHLPQQTRVRLDAVYGHRTHLKLLQVDDKMPIESGCVYFAPSGYHLLVEKDLSFSLSQDELVHFSRPSIDVLFESAARSLGKSCAAVLLTGANFDGGDGLHFLREKGALTIVQDPKTAEISTMPLSALKKDENHEVLSLLEIAGRLNSLPREKVDE